jgi:CRP/FNR family transcriptional regulator
MSFEPLDITCYNQLHERFLNIFSDELIQDICYNGQLKNFQTEETIVNIGDEMKYFPLIVSGSLKILTEDKDGKELLLYYLEVGDTCAVTLTLASHVKKSKIRAIAEEITQVLFLPISKVDEWMEKYKEWRHFIMETYNYRMSEMLEAIDNLAFHNMEERLLKYLRDKAMVSGSKEIHGTHAQIANDLHSSRVVISRMLGKLEKDGLIKHSRNKVELVRL